MTPKQAARKLEQAAEKLLNGEQRLITDTRNDLFKTAYRWSSGPFSLAELAKRDHPYARRHKTPLLSPRRINVQTGVFRSSWVGAEKPSGSGTTVELYNTDPKAAKYLEPGTSRMFARPVDTAIAAEVFQRTDQRVEKMIEAALRGLK